MEQIAHPERDQIVTALQEISLAWQQRRFDDLAHYFHKRVVLVAPAFAARIEGRDAVVDSYREFMSRAVITSYSEQQPTIDVWGQAAIATFAWTMNWEVQGRTQGASGHDVFQFIRGGGRWLATWRFVVEDRG